MNTNAAATETAPALPDATLYEVVQLDVLIIKARRAGRLDIASSWEGLAQGLRSGQLSLSRYLTSATWGALFGGRAMA